LPPEVITVPRILDDGVLASAYFRAKFVSYGFAASCTNSRKFILEIINGGSLACRKSAGYYFAASLKENTYPLENNSLRAYADLLK